MPERTVCDTLGKLRITEDERHKIAMALKFVSEVADTVLETFSSVSQARVIAQRASVQ